MKRTGHARRKQRSNTRNVIENNLTGKRSPLRWEDRLIRDIETIKREVQQRETAENRNSPRQDRNMSFSASGLFLSRSLLYALFILVITKEDRQLSPFRCP